MPSTPTSSELIKQITETFAKAQERFHELRDAVERTSEMAIANAKANWIGQEREKAFRDLGEAVWSAVQEGELSLPSSVGPALKRVQDLEKKRQAQAAAILDILKEGEEAADRMRTGAAKALPKSGMASKTKKR
jgi:hypothetical protein